MIEWTAQNVVVTSLLAVCVWGICRVHRIGPAWKHALWLVLMLKLVMPPLVNWPWAVHDLIGPLKTPAGTNSMETSATVAQSGDRTELQNVVNFTASAPSEIQRTNRVPSRLAAISRWLVPGMALIWFTGFAIFAIIQIRRIRSVGRVLRISDPAGPDLISLVCEVANQLNVPVVETRSVAGIASPFVWCVHRPVLLWPAALSSKLSEESVRALLAHELAHLKRRDHLVGWLELAAGCLWWWNPVYWCIRHQLRENAELACDAWAIDAMDANPSVRHAYAEALLSVCESIAGDPKPSNPMPVVGVDTGNRRFLERRLTMIVRDRLPFRLSRAGVLLTVLITLTLVPMWSLRAAPETATPGAAVAQTNPAPRIEVQATPEIALTPGPFKVEPPRPAQITHEILPIEIRDPQAVVTGAVVSNDGTADAVLSRRLTLNFSNASLKNALDYLRDTADANLYVPWKALKAIGVEESTPVNLKLRDVPLRRALSLVLADATGDNRLTYHVEDGVIEVATKAATSPFETGLNAVWVGENADPFGIARTFSWERGTFPPEVQILSLRNRVGESIELEVTGQLTGSVWGGDEGIYTDDSTLGAAAVHAGLLKPGETGIIRVTSLPGRPQYEGSVRNGVRSESFRQWDGSYRLERVK